MISAVVPTCGGASRLARYLPSVLASLAAAGEPWELIVVDDGGGGAGELPPGVRLLTLAENRGYGPAVNAGAASSAGERLLILNDDVELASDAVSVLSRHLVPPVFAVVPAIASPLAACGDEGGKGACINAGLLEILETKAAAVHPTLYAVGCCVLCDRSAFLELGGYDEAFAPFFWEDVDLGYRAWRRGLAILHVPEASCRHEGSATLRERHSAQEREEVFFRNRVLFHLRNVQDAPLRAASLGAWAAFALFDDRVARRRGLAGALERFAALGRRPAHGFSDAQILAQAGGDVAPAAPAL